MQKAPKPGAGKPNFIGNQIITKPKYTGNQSVITTNYTGNQTIQDCNTVQTDTSNIKLVWGSKVTSEFRKKVIAISQELNFDPNHLMAIIAFETGRTFSASKWNGTAAVGLIQFTGITAKQLGTTKDAISKMTEIDQLDLVKKDLALYAKTKSGTPRLNSIENLYMAVNWPNAIGRGDDYVLYENSPLGKNPNYNGNSGLDIDKDGKVTVKEAASKAREMLELGKLHTN